MAEQARGAVPIVLYPGEREAEDDITLTRWAHIARRLPSINYLRASASKDDVRLELKLRYELAKLKAKGQIHSLIVLCKQYQLLVKHPLF